MDDSPSCAARADSNGQPSSLRPAGRALVEVRQKTLDIGIVAPAVLYFPISHEHDHRLYKNFKASILPNQIANSAGISPRLIKSFPLFFATANEDPLPVLELHLARTLADLHFDGKHPRWPDDHVIDIELIPNDVVEAAEVIHV